VLQHARFDFEILQCLKEDVYRRQCSGYDNTSMPKDDYVPPLGPTDEVEDDVDDIMSPAEPPLQTEVDHGARAETTMAHTAATTALIASARKAIRNSCGRRWAKDERRDAACAAGTITVTSTDASGNLGPRMQKARRLLEAKQIKWQQAGVLAAKKYAMYTVYWYPKNPRWVPDFVCGPIVKKSVTSDGFEEGFSPSRNQKMCWRPFPDVILPNGTKRPWTMIEDEEVFLELAIASDRAYDEAKQREAHELPRDVSIPWEGPPQKIPRCEKLLAVCITEAPFTI